jgi:hypothetical protein
MFPGRGVGFLVAVAVAVGSGVLVTVGVLVAVGLGVFVGLSVSVAVAVWVGSRRKVGIQDDKSIVEEISNANTSFNFFMLERWFMRISPF